MALSGSLVSAETNSGRTLTVNWTATQSTANNSSTVSWNIKGSGSDSGGVYVREVRLTINGSQAYYKDSSAVSLASGTTLASGSIAIPHNSDGSKTFSMTIEVASYQWLINTSKSKSFTLNKIARTSDFSVPSFTLGTAGTITITKANSAFTHTLSWVYGNQSGTIATKTTDTSVSWTPPLELAQQTPNGTSGQGTMACQTYSGDTLVGTTYKNFTINVPASVKPTISSVSVSADNSANATIKGWGLYVSGYTKPVITANSPAGAQGSTIQGFDISGALTATVAGSTLSYTVEAFKSSGSKTFTVKAKDSRGRESDAKTSSAITVYDYSPPKITTFIVNRTSANAKKVSVTANWSFSSVNGKNAVARSLYYKKKSASTWTQYTTAIAQNTATTLTVDFEEGSSYDFRFTVTDSVGNFAVMTSSVPTISVTMHYKAGGKGIGIGKIPENDAFEVAMVSEFIESVTFDKTETHKGAETHSGLVTHSGANMFNGNVSMKNAPKIADVTQDYLVASGQSGVWTYRKWNSGIAEVFTTYFYTCTGNLTFTSSSWASGYVPTEGYVQLPNYPFAFVTTPSISVIPIMADSGAGGDMMIIFNCNGSGYEYKTKPIPFKPWRGTSATIGHPKFSCRAIGYWK